MVEGFQLHLGGHLGSRSRLGRKSRGLKITSAELVDYVVGLLKTYQAERADGQTFADWVEKVDEAKITHDAVVARA